MARSLLESVNWAVPADAFRAVASPALAAWLDANETRMLRVIENVRLAMNAVAQARQIRARRDLRQAQPQRVTYKGKPYNLLWSGPTKHGQRARLQFLDGSKDFWVDAALISGASHSTGDRAPRGKYLCDECGEYVVPGTSCWETGMRH